MSDSFYCIKMVLWCLYFQYNYLIILNLLFSLFKLRLYNKMGNGKEGTGGRAWVVSEPIHGLYFRDLALIKRSRELAIVVINKIVLQLNIRLTLPLQLFFRFPFYVLFVFHTHPRPPTPPFAGMPPEWR